MVLANSIVRSICLFSSQYKPSLLKRAAGLENKLLEAGFEVQTKRLCVPYKSVQGIESKIPEPYLISIGQLPAVDTYKRLRTFIHRSPRVNFSLDITSGPEIDDVKVLFDLMHSAPKKTFDFAFTFSNVGSSPFFPAATYSQEGFSLGLQSTSLFEGSQNLQGWRLGMRYAWHKLCEIFEGEKDFLGIDSSIAPLGSGSSSLVQIIRNLGQRFSSSTTTDIYTQLSEFIKKSPRAVGLCGLMFPCLEDFELASEYELGNFSIERNLFLSLHSGLGIDTYPVGVDESPERVLEILKLVAALSRKHNKPLSARFVSDGKAEIGQKTNFGNKYLRDVFIRPL